MNLINSLWYCFVILHLVCYSYSFCGSATYKRLRPIFAQEKQRYKKDNNETKEQVEYDEEDSEHACQKYFNTLRDRPIQFFVRCAKHSVKVASWLIKDSESVNDIFFSVMHRYLLVPYW